jgi:Polyketide cyclase / dehydrase and lipid transport
MHTTVTLFLEDAGAPELFEQVATLDRYPAWMKLVHRVEPMEPDEGRPAWRVELRARIGPFARSKQLRMVRTAFEPDHHARFERVQDDHRDHAEWILSATVDEADGGATLTTELTYSGKFWGSGALQRALDDEIRRGKTALRRLVIEEPTQP